MVDVFSPQKRSEVMARIRGGDTGPERKVRALLHAHGYRFTVHGPGNRLLPGRPDIVLPRFRTVVFVHGCFWHGHENCPDFRMPSTRTGWWEAKIAGNKERDKRVERALLGLGWHVVTIWACAVKNKAGEAWLGARFPVLIGVPGGGRRRGAEYGVPRESPAMSMVAENHEPEIRS